VDTQKVCKNSSFLHVANLFIIYLFMAILNFSTQGFWPARLALYSLSHASSLATNFQKLKTASGVAQAERACPANMRP
jgi:hypothetical protein